MKLSLFELLITRPLGFIIRMIYSLVQNYGLSIILFTIVVKLILMPLQAKSQKAMKKQQKIQPIIAELQKKYENDRQKLQTEMMKVYKENNVSMSGGCLPLLIQFPILIGLYSVIRRPITYIKGVNFADEAVLERIKTVLAKMTEKFPDIVGKLSAFSPEQMYKNYQIQLSTWADKLGLAKEYGWNINFKFLGLDLSGVPSSALSAISRGDFSDIGTVLLILIPIFAVLSTWLSMRQSQKLTQNPNVKQNDDDPTQSMSKSMNMMMPIMTGFFTFSLPSGIGIYWIVSSLMQIVQQYVLDKYFNEKEDDFVVTVQNKNRKNGKKRRRS
ncbi:MAG: YidC/Oxa1 family membrane protein insertase [Clostridia bacterium]|nr:YidC/Oxa1 family membrane protein insertase [Clostridia bacterium]